MIIDSHCHIDFADFDSDRDAVLQHAYSLGIHKIVVPGVMQSSWQKIKDCCDTYPQLYPCYGLHPYFINQHRKDDLIKLSEWIQTNRAVAIGECGLDYYLKNLDKTSQQFYFEKQLDIAIEHNLPVVIHARKSTEDVILAIKQRPSLRGMIHSYSGSYEQALQLIDKNFYLSFGGPVTHDKSTKLRKLVASLPLSSILVETDAPDQPTAQARSRRNEPANITEVIQSVASLHNTNIDEVSRITSENAKTLFQLV